MKQLGLLIRLIIGIIAGILIGMCGQWFGIADTAFFVTIIRLLATFTSLFSTFLSFMIPLIILSFITVSMAELGKKANRLFGLTLLLAYGTTVISGLLTFFIGKAVLPGLIQPITGDVLESNAFEPLFTITQEDINALGVEGEPQQGSITIAEFKEKGCYKTQRSKGDALTYRPFEAFIADPVANPAATASGKFEIYSATLSAVVSSLGYSAIPPIAKWQIGDPEQGAGTQTDAYPLLLWTPHSLRRSHTVNDNVVSLREAFPQECFMSTVDAEARGIKSGDTVLMTSPYGKVLRPAKVLPTIVPGAVALQDGAWIRIDEETGIDLGGDPNILQAPKASGQASQSWTGTLVQVEKYDGPLTLKPDKDMPIVMPVGIEE